VRLYVAATADAGCCCCAGCVFVNSERWFGIAKGSKDLHTLLDWKAEVQEMYFRVVLFFHVSES
jgi:hypothetical protein